MRVFARSHWALILAGRRRRLANGFGVRSSKAMRQLLVLAICVVASGCATASQAPPNYELTWVKPHVRFDAFVADVDACNASAEAAGRSVEPRRGDPANDLSPPIVAWRWLAHGADVDAAMARAYEVCFEPRGYVLAYVTEPDARAFADIGSAPLGADEPVGDRAVRRRQAQLQLLHRLAIAERPPRARIETRLQRRPLVSYVAGT
jgi:hypothetical protein